MASNFTQRSSADGSFDIDPQTPDNQMQQTLVDADHRMGAEHLGFVREAGRVQVKTCNTTTTTTDSNLRINDVQLIRNRNIRFSQRERNLLELLCEDRISKHKLEEIHCSLPSSIKSTFIMTFSPDGQRVASTHGDHRIYICDLNTGKLLDTLEGHPKTPWCLAWHPSNRDILASGCLAGEVRVWDLRSKACDSWTSENHSIISSLDFHPKERVLVIATGNDILFWDWSESEPYAKTTTMHDREKVKFVVFDSSGRKLITGISNLPKYAGYSSDSLQTRIIDGYLSQRTIDSLPTENMTQDSEISAATASPTTVASVNLNENFSGNQTASPIERIRLGGNDNNTSEQEIIYRNTLLLSRVANLYRQLESLEDSMRHTSFAPYMNIRPVETISSADSAPSDVNSHDQIADRSNERLPSSTETNRANTPSTNEETVSQQVRDDSNVYSSGPTANSFEPFLVTFDESLEQLQLPILIMDGHSVNLATVTHQYPIEASRQVHHAMQFESINQVNQNFIRISKLMSSARLYRQLVQQIVANTSGDRPYLPNQILTAQSVSSRSPRHSPNIPIVLRNYSLVNSVESGGPVSHNRTHDPIMAIEFRNTARNVPLTTICKIDLLAARALCILHAQVLVEHAVANTRPLVSNDEVVINDELLASTPEGQTESSAQNRSNSTDSSIHSSLENLHATLAAINHAALTTSNAYTHITNLRVIINKLHNSLSATLRSPADGQKLGDLMHNIAYSLTDRRWNVPLGITLNDIRLDVIHTLCIVDLTLHFVRQAQLLQMTRVSLIARVEESRRPNAVIDVTSIVQQPTSDATPQTSRQENSSSSQPGPSSGKLSGACKRKSSEPKSESKRVRTNSSQSTVGPDIAMDTDSSRSSSISNTHSPQSNLTLDHSSPNDRMVLWNSPQSHIEQSLQRLLVATSSSTSHILVRVYHRLHGTPPHQVLDQAIDRPQPQVESRRRALSQDHSVNQQETTDTSTGSTGVGSLSRQHRVRPPTAYQVNMLPHGSQVHQTSGPLGFDAWQRNPQNFMYPGRAPGQHLWFNQWTIPLPMSNSNFRVQCWNFTRDSVPKIKDSQMNVITHKCRIHNDSSVDVSSDGDLLACLVPRDDGHSCFPGFELRIFSLKASDFGSCYYKLLQGNNALSVSLSPSGNYVVVGLATQKGINYDQNNDVDLKIGKVFRLGAGNSLDLVRDIKVKRDDTSFCLNAIKWMPRGIVYSVGPQHLQRYHTTRMRNVVAS